VIAGDPPAIAQAQLRLGRELHIGWRTPLRVISPAARQVKPTVDQRPRSMAWAIPAGEKEARLVAVRLIA
jgi:hypothetical protein